MEAISPQDRINDKIVAFGLRINEAISGFGARRVAARRTQAPMGMRSLPAISLRAAILARLEELGVKAPVYAVKESEGAKKDSWYLRVENVGTNRSYELAVKSEGNKQFKVRATAYKSLDLLTFVNRLEEYKASFQADDYMAVVGPACKVLSWLQPLVREGLESAHQDDREIN
jgi:hypothetical protein